MADAGTLGSAGERAALARIVPRLPAAASALVGPGDDAAVLAAPSGRYVVTTDLMVHGPDFRLAWSTPEDLGWKAAASNLADVAAMGASPTALVVALAAPAATPVAVLEGIADGLAAGCEALAPGCGVVGGDLSVSDTLMIAVTAFGDPGDRAPVLRSGARAGDVVAVSGLLGFAAAGIRLLYARGVDAAGAPDRAAGLALRRRHARELDAQLRPRPPVADGVAAALAGATAMLDVSDGVLLDASRLADASGVAVRLDSAALLDGTEGSAVSARDVLAGGEDHALLATFPPDARLPGAFRAVGVVAAGAGVLVDGRRVPGSGGWDPYEAWDGRGG